MALAAMRRDVHEMLQSEDVLLEELSSRLKGVLPVQPSPILVPADSSSSSLKSTLLGGHLISCFVIGGECRLCFPQIISVVLQGIKVEDVNDLFVDLNINISVASKSQLDILKVAGVMPMTADSCGLITKSDAERLVAKLLPSSSGPLRIQVPRTDAVPVCHDCFGGCSGVLLPSLPAEEQIECDECKLMFTGEKFVSHTHSVKEIQRVCHWGFDSANWRYYLHLPEKCQGDVRARQRLEHFKYPQFRLAKRQANFKANDAEAATAKMQKLSGIFDLGSFMEARRIALPSISNPMFAAQMSTLPCQLQSLLALQLSASQLPSTSAQPAKAAAPLSASAFSLLPTVEQKQPEVSRSDLLAKPVPVRATECKSDTALDNNAVRNSERDKTGLPLITAGISLEKLLEENLSGGTLSLARMLLAEERQTEARRREKLETQNEDLRRENSLLQSALAGPSLLPYAKSLAARTAIC